MINDKLKEYLIEKNWSNLYTNLNFYRNLNKIGKFCCIGLCIGAFGQLSALILKIFSVPFYITGVVWDFSFGFSLTFLVSMFLIFLINERVKGKELRGAKVKIIDELYGDGDKLKQLVASAIEQEQLIETEPDLENYLSALQHYGAKNIDGFRNVMLDVLDSYAERFNIESSKLENSLYWQENQESRKKLEQKKNMDKEELIRILNLKKLDVSNNNLSDKKNHTDTHTSIGQATKYLYHK